MAPTCLLLAFLLGTSFHVATSTFIFGTTAAAATTVSVSTASLVTGAVATAALLLGGAAVKAAARRGKRETAICLPSTSAELYFLLAASTDAFGCARRFVCELEATVEEDDLAQEELLIRDVFRTGVADNTTARAFFQNAGHLGWTKGLEACASAFGNCLADRKSIFLTFKEMQKA